jgi:hypothetical protein
VRVAHRRQRLDVACLASLAEPANQQRAEPQGAELRVNDDAADRADVAVGEPEVLVARKAPAAQNALAGGAAWYGIGEDGDGDEAAVLAALWCVTDGPDVGGGEGAGSEVVKRGELVVVAQMAARKAEGAGKEGRETGKK